MILEEITKWSGYELLDSGDGERLERFGDFVLRRPDPGVLWHRSLPEADWLKANASFRKRGGAAAADKHAAADKVANPDDGEDKGNWQNGVGGAAAVPEKWLMHFSGVKSAPAADISFYAKLTPFKHTGVFPEQAANWEYIAGWISGYAAAKPAGPPLKLLNLFGYTGVASVLAAKLGAEVTHVDASKPSISWAKENMLASGLPEDAIRWIFDDCLKFVKREVKRGKTYDAIILDPPAFGRGAKGEVWKFSEDLPKLLAEIQKIISPNFQFLIINAYAVSVSALLLKNLLEDLKLPKKAPQWQVDYGELVLKENNPRGRELSTGIFARLY